MNFYTDKDEETIEVGEEVTQKTATEETEIAVGAEGVGASEDLEVDLTYSEVAQDEASAKLSMGEAEDTEIEMAISDDVLEEKTEDNVHYIVSNEFQGFAGTSTNETSIEESGYDMEGKSSYFRKPK